MSRFEFVDTTKEHVKAQQQAFFDFQLKLIEGVLEGTQQTTVKSRLGGLGLEKTKDVALERALSGKCGNVICKNSVKDVRSIKNPEAKVFLKNGQVVTVEAFANYCSEGCFDFFENSILKSRPVVDVWNLHNDMLKTDVDPSKEKPAGRSQGMVGTIKEKTKTKGVKTMFNTGVDPEIETIVKARSKNSKNVSFKDERTIFASDDGTKPKVSKNVLHQKHNDEDLPELEGDAPETSQDERSDDGLDHVIDFMDEHFTFDKTKMFDGLSPYVTVWDFLTRVTTSFTKDCIYSGGVDEWEWKSLLDADVIAERKLSLETQLLESLKACDISNSPVFMMAASQKIRKLAATMDVSRPIPVFTPDHWVLLDIILLSCLDDVGRLTGYGFSSDAIVKCFGSSIATVTKHEFEKLKSILREFRISN